MADLHVPIRAGHATSRSSAGSIHYVLENESLLPGVRRRTTRTRATIVDEDFRDTEDLDGLFSRLRPRDGHVRPRRRWQYEGVRGRGRGGRQREHADAGVHGDARRAGIARRRAAARRRRCSTRAASSRSCKRHFARYTPEMVERDLRHPARAASSQVAEALCAQLGPRAHDARSATRSAGRSTPPACRSSAPRRSCSCCSATSAARAAASWRCAATRRSRARPTSRRSTTCCPATCRCRTRARRTRRSTSYIEQQRRRRPGWWANCDTYIVSLLKAWCGDAATAENDFGFGHLPRITGDHSHYPTMLRACSTATVEGFFVDGPEPGRRLAPTRGCSGAALREPRVARGARPGRDRDRDASGTTRPRSRPASCAPRTSTPRSSSCPPPRTSRRTGTLHQHPAAAAVARQGGRAAGRRRSELWFMLPPRPARARAATPARRAERDRPIARPHLGLPDRRARTTSPTPRPCCTRSTATTSRPASRCRGFTRARRTTARRPAAAGSTPASTPTASTRPRGASRGSEQTWVAPEWGWAWPANRRILYNRASADPDGHARGRERKTLRLVGRRSRASGPATTCPTSRPTSRPTTARPTDAKGDGRDRAATTRSSCRPTARGWLFAPSGPGRRAAADALRAARVAGRQPALPGAGANPAAHALDAPGEPATRDRRPALPVRRHDLPADRAPHRGRHEPHGCRSWPSCSRRCSARSTRSWPRERGHRGRRLDDDRHRARARSRRACWSPSACAPLRVDGRDRAPGRPAVALGLRAGSSPGDAANDLLALALDPNVHIQESKAFDLRRRARARGRAARRSPALVDELPAPRRRRRATPRRGRDHGAERQRVGFFTDTTVCIGCKACEVACKEWNELPDGRPRASPASPTTTPARWAPTPGATCVRRAASASTARRRPTATSRWLMSSDVCKHCTHAGCLDVCPTGALFRTEFGTVVVQPDVCNGCGYCVPACPFGVIDRREDDGRACKCTLCYDRLKDGLEPACAKACPTDSIQFGDARRAARAGATRGSRRCTTAGVDDARLYGDDPDDGVGGAGAFFLLLDEPEVYGLPPDPVVDDARPRRDVARGGAARRARRCVAAAMRGRRGARAAGDEPSPLLLRPADHQGAGVDAGDPARTSSSAAWPAPPRRLALLRRAARRTTRSRGARGWSRSPASAVEPAAADLRPRAARALPQHAARVQGHLADERRLVGPRRAAARRPALAAGAQRARLAPAAGRARRGAPARARPGARRPTRRRCSPTPRCRPGTRRGASCRSCSPPARRASAGAALRCSRRRRTRRRRGGWRSPAPRASSRRRRDGAAPGRARRALPRGARRPLRAGARRR